MTGVYESLSKEGRKLLDETMAHLDPLYDGETRLLHGEGPYGPERRNVRASAHYALGLLIRSRPGDAARAAQVIQAVCDTQYDHPDEIFHGTFRRDPREPVPPVDAFPFREVTPLSRYRMDMYFQHVTNALRKRLDADGPLHDHAPRIQAMLEQAASDVLPVVWRTYDPNWREFILTTFALILQFFEGALPAATVRRIDHAAKLGLAGAISRTQSGLTPPNTNIEIMHVFIADFFGSRLKDASARDYALKYAEDFARRYFTHHSVNEFNSPTYCGVDLTAIGCWRRFAPHPRIRELGERIEAGLWEDIADFYNHALRNVCGPFSRNYEMDMSIHTCMHALMYMGLGEERFPEHPYTTESDHNPLMVLTGVNIPACVQARLLTTGGVRSVTRQFHELSERGDPRDNAALCTAQAYITDTFMAGAMAGSRNVSGQLHPAVIYWRDKTGGVSGMRLLRSDADGRSIGMHTVIFDCHLEQKRMTISVRSQVNQAVTVYFEFDCPEAQSAHIGKDLWEISGLGLKVDASAPIAGVVREDGRLKVNYLLPQGGGLNFVLDCSLQGEERMQ